MPTLWERIYATSNLIAAYRLARRGKWKKDEVQRYSRSLRDNLRVLQAAFRSGEWQPGPTRDFPIFEPKQRLISAAPFRDRVAHHAVMRVVDPILEKFQVYHSYACRKRKGTHACVLQAYQNQQRFAYFLRMDIRKYFQSIPQQRLLALLAKRIWDGQTREFFRKVVESHGEKSQGLPIGNLTSQHLANFYLSHLDHFILQQLRPLAYVRYMDDFVLWFPEPGLLPAAREQIRAYLREELGLELKDQATVCAPARRGLVFLGFRILPQRIRLAGKARLRLKRHIRQWDRELRHGAAEISLARRAASVMGWCHFAHAHALLNSWLGNPR